MRKKVIKKISLLVLAMTIVLSSSIYINLIINLGTKRKIITSFNENNPVNKDLKTAKISRAIHIYNNWSATKSAGICTGNGIYSDPYVIEDLVIDGGDSRICILIEGSNAHFIIVNCTVFNSGGPPVFLHAGIYLQYVSNGQLINNSCSFNPYGILLSSGCTDNSVTGNNVTNNEIGIRIFFEGSSNTFSNNIITNNYEGISIEGDDNTVLNNIVINNNAGLSIMGTGNVVSRNTFNNNIQGVNIIESWQNTISENNASFNTHSGIRLSVSDRNTISGNTVNNNTEAGLYISYNSYDNTITGNTATYNEYGVYLIASDDNTITGNTASNNEYGIYLAASDDNTVSGNKFSGNTVCIYENDCEGNEFSDNEGCNYPSSEVSNGFPPNLVFNIILLLSGISIALIIVIVEIRKVRKRK